MVQLRYESKEACLPSIKSVGERRSPERIFLTHSLIPTLIGKIQRLWGRRGKEMRSLEEVAAVQRSVEDFQAANLALIERMMSELAKIGKVTKPSRPGSKIESVDFKTGNTWIMYYRRMPSHFLWEGCEDRYNAGVPAIVAYFGDHVLHLGLNGAYVCPRIPVEENLISGILDGRWGCRPREARWVSSEEIHQMLSKVFAVLTQYCEGRTYQ
ncbi:MAG: hypothetical protein ABH814_00485 [bacterium]